MRDAQLQLVIAAALGLSTFLMFSCMFMVGHRNSVAVSLTPQGQRSLKLRMTDYFDPKTVTPRFTGKDTVTVTIYVTKERRDLKFKDNFNEALSVFTTGMLQIYGTGKVQYIIRERTDCSSSCKVGDPNAAPLFQSHEPCLAVSRHSKKMLCDIDLLRCNYRRCKTMVTNDEFCTKINLPFDARQYYTSARPELGYLPIGPRWDSWESLQRMRRSPGFFVLPSSKRGYAFNAIFSRSTNSERKELAEEIEQKSQGKFPIFAAMASQWERTANDEATDQVSTDGYMSE